MPPRFWPCVWCVPSGLSPPPARVCRIHLELWNDNVLSSVGTDLCSCCQWQSSPGMTTSSSVALCKSVNIYIYFVGVATPVCVSYAWPPLSGLHFDWCPCVLFSSCWWWATFSPLYVTDTVQRVSMESPWCAGLYGINKIRKEPLIKGKFWIQSYTHIRTRTR